MGTLYPKLIFNYFLDGLAVKSSAFFRNNHPLYKPMFLIPDMLFFLALPIVFEVQHALMLPIPTLPTPLDGKVRKNSGAVRGLEWHFILKRDVSIKKHVGNDYL